MAKITSRILNIFRKSFKIPSNEDYFIARDHLGNTYYEKLADKKRGTRARRWVETADGDRNAIPDVPIEWESWLRNRRKEAPTQEMLDANYIYMLKTQHRAKELEMKDQLEKENSSVGKSENESITESVQGGSENRKFPLYEGFELKPGTKIKKSET